VIEFPVAACNPSKSALAKSLRINLITPLGIRTPISSNAKNRAVGGGLALHVRKA
jgi:hypothetical protein